MSSVRTRLLLASLIALQPASLHAQESAAVTAENALENAAESWSIKVEEADLCAEDDLDPKVIPEVIVVCRSKIDPEQFMSGITPEIRADTEVTGSGAPRAQDPGGMLMPCSAYTVCMSGLGSVPPPAIMVDFDALPETPAGSDAARLYGGPTDESVIAEAQAEPEEEEIDLTDKARAGLDDETYGP